MTSRQITNKFVRLDFSLGNPLTISSAININYPVSKITFSSSFIYDNTPELKDNINTILLLKSNIQGCDEMTCFSTLYRNFTPKNEVIFQNPITINGIYTFNFFDYVDDIQNADGDGVLVIHLTFYE